jgi:hypothetical protein
MEEGGSGPMGFPYGALLTEDLALAIQRHSRRQPDDRSRLGAL